MQQTSKLQLGLYGRGLAGDIQEDEPADISGINDNFRTIDQFIGMAIPCTSTSRPANPFTGLGIYETDTKRGYIFTGLIYELLFDANFATGFQGTSAERDAYWGAPTTGSTTPEQQARVALASQFPQWYNKDKGYQEQYFAKTGDPLAIPGTYAKTPGWYPSSSGVRPIAGVHANGPSNYGVGTTLITTQGGMFTISEPAVGFTTPVVNGTGSGLRLVAPLEGNYRVEALAHFNSSIINLFVKKNSVSADSGGYVGGDSGSGINSDNFRGFSRVVPLNAADFLVLAWYASTGGSALDFSFRAEWAGVRTV